MNRPRNEIFRLFLLTLGLLAVSLACATSPVEDMAESWTNFVLKPSPEGKRIADEKALFFYDFPELVTFQQQIIAGLCPYGR